MINFGAGNLTWESRNHVLNGNMEVWSAGPAAVPDNWTLTGVGSPTIARESSMTHNGVYSTKLICSNSVGDYTNFYQQIHVPLGLSYWKGKIVTVGAWIWCAVSSYACVAVGDGVGSAFSYHTGTSSWQWLTANLTIDSAATYVLIACILYRHDTIHIAYFDQATLVESSQILGKTFGGGTIELSELSYKGVRSQNLTSVVTGGEGIIHMFQWNNSVDITNNSTIRDYGKLTIACNNMTLVMDHCKLFLSGGLSFGQLQQQPFDLKFSFKKSPTTGNVITIS